MNWHTAHCLAFCIELSKRSSPKTRRQGVCCNDDSAARSSIHAIDISTKKYGVLFTLLCFFSRLLSSVRLTLYSQTLQSSFAVVLSVIDETNFCVFIDWSTTPEALALLLSQRKSDLFSTRAISCTRESLTSHHSHTLFVILKAFKKGWASALTFCLLDALTNWISAPHF